MLHTGSYAKSYINVDHQWKRNWKLCIGSKVMAKTKSGVKFWPFPLYFGPFLERKWPFQRQHFPWVPRAHPYIFGISRTRRMGKQTELIVKMTFDFFWAPLLDRIKQFNLTGVAGKAELSSICYKVSSPPVLGWWSDLHILPMSVGEGKIPIRALQEYKPDCLRKVHIRACNYKHILNFILAPSSLQLKELFLGS